MYPEVSSGLQVVQLILASLLHGFDLQPHQLSQLTWERQMAITFVKATPLEVLLTPCLSTSLYGEFGFCNCFRTQL